MILQTGSTSTVTKNGQKNGVLSLLSGQFIGGGIDTEDCGPISDGYFRILMVLVVVATFAFGGFVHGWFH